MIKTVGSSSSEVVYSQRFEPFSKIDELLLVGSIPKCDRMSKKIVFPETRANSPSNEPSLVGIGLVVQKLTSFEDLTLSQKLMNCYSLVRDQNVIGS